MYTYIYIIIISYHIVNYIIYFILQFADDIDLLAGSKSELQALTESLEKSDESYCMERSQEKTVLLKGD